MDRDAGLLRVGVKYCGGCRPGYDRTALAETLAERLSGRAVLTGPGEEDVDMVLALQGCATACADLGTFEGLFVYTLTDPVQADDFIKIVMSPGANPKASPGASTEPFAIAHPDNEKPAPTKGVLTRDEIASALEKWNRAWEEYDLQGVLDLMGDNVFFENWNGGRVRGKDALREAWQGWFEGKDFRFIPEDLFIDEEKQKVLYQWTLEWPCPDPSHENKTEKRKGVDVMTFQNRCIAVKRTYSQTALEIGGARYSLKLT